MKCPSCGVEDDVLDRKVFCPCGAFINKFEGGMKVQASFKDGSKSVKGISQRYYESIQKRKSKKSEETIAQERGEI